MEKITRNNFEFFSEEKTVKNIFYIFLLPAIKNDKMLYFSLKNSR